MGDTSVLAQPSSLHSMEADDSVGKFGNGHVHGDDTTGKYLKASPKPQT
jgi:hypothetical protein